MPPVLGPLKSPQELHLFHRLVAQAGEMDSEGKSYLMDPYLGSTSKIAKGEWNFRREQILVLESCSEWETLFGVCHDLLEGARRNGKSMEILDARGADWLVWKTYIKAANELQLKQRSV